MALDKVAMAQLIKTNIEALTNYPNPGESPVFVDKRVLEAFCQGVIDHIKASGEVLPGTFVVNGGSNWPISGEGTIL